jgi:hypothetical protein
MSIFLLPKIVVKRMDKGIRRFFWQGNKLKTSHPFMKRSKIWKSKNKKRGGHQRSEEDEHKPPSEMVVCIGKLRGNVP